MKLENIDIDETLKKVESLLSVEKTISPALLSMIKTMIMLLKLLTNRVGLNSSNSSTPPSSDPNRLKPTRKKSGKKPSGQKGHVGTTLKQTEEPDEIKIIKVDQRSLPKGSTYKEVGFDKRQVFNIDISRFVTEYQAQILEDENGNRYVAEFPENVNSAVQYGNTLKAHAVYMSQYQLLPYKRIEEYFTDQLQIPISQGSLFNFNKTANNYLLIFSKTR